MNNYMEELRGFGFASRTRQSDDDDKIQIQDTKIVNGYREDQEEREEL